MRFRPALALIAVLLATPATAEPWTLNRDRAEVIFSLDRAGFSLVEGRFDAIDAQVDFDPAARTATSVSLVMDAASVDTRWAARDDVIRGEDMLDAAAHPRITFVSVDVRAVSADASVVTGLLTLKGVTREERFDVALRRMATSAGRPVAEFTVTGRIDRTDYGVDAFPAMGTTLALRIDLALSPAR